MRQKVRLTALEAKSPKRPAFDIQKPENREWLSDFRQRNLRDNGNCSIDRISAEDQTAWARRVKDLTLADFIAALIEVRGMF